MKKKIVFTLAAVFMLFFIIPICYAASQNEAVSEAVGKWMTSQKEAQYNTKLNSPFDKDKTGVKEIINPESGDITFNIPVFSVDSVSEMSLDAALTYNINDTKDKEESADETGNSVNIELSKADRERTVFGAGFSLNLPYVEVRENVGTFVSLPGGGIYKADFKPGAGLEGYTIKDLVFEKDATEIIQGKRSAYKLTYPDGSRYYFAADGKLIQERDRYNNAVFYNYGSFNGLEVLQSIMDKSGRSIEFAYMQNEITIKNGERSYTLYLKDTGDGKRKELEKVKDPEGNITTFIYGEVPISYTVMTGKTSTTNNYHIIKEIKYPTGASTVYNYEKSKKGTSIGNLEYLRVVERKDIQNGEVYNRLQYKYWGEPDGYPNYKEENLPADYTYGRRVYEDDGTVSCFVYNGEHNLINKRVLTGEKKEQEVDTAYNNMKAPVLVKNRIYNENGETVETTEEYEYDRNGNVTTSDKYEAGHKGEQEVKSTYSLAYNLKTSEERKIDADTKIKQVYKLDEKVKNPIGLTVYENGQKIKDEKYSYDSSGNLIEKQEDVSEGDYQTTRYEYDSKYGMAALTAVEYPDVKNADGTRTNIRMEYTYDVKSGLMLSKTDPNGNVERYLYDNNDRVIQVTDAAGNTECTKYNDKENTIITTDKLGNQLKYFYDPLGNLAKVVDLKTNEVLSSLAYDHMERKIRTTDNLGNYQTTTYGKLDRIDSYKSYDSSNNLLAKTDFRYVNAVNLKGKKTMMLEAQQGVGADTIKSRQYFDSMGNLLKTETVGSSDTLEENYTYDYIGRNLSYTDRDGNISYKKYDAFGNVIKMQNPLGETSYAEYNLMGNMVKSITPEGKEIYYTYDNLGRLIKQRKNGDEQAQVTSNFYDNNGNLIKQIDPLGKVIEYEYDYMGRNTLIRTGNGKDGYQEAEKKYDAAGKMIKESYGLSSAQKRGTSYSYNHLGQLVEEKDELNHAITYNYDTAGNLESKKDKNGTITSYTYDGLSRPLTETNDKDHKTINYSYDGLGRISRVKDSIGEYNFKYDQFSNLMQLRNPLEIYQNYTYDKSGRVTSYKEERSGVQNQKLAYEYDKAGKLLTLNTDIASISYNYDKDGKLLQEKNSTTNEVTKYSYNMLSQLTEKDIWQKDKLQTSQKYEYDLLGRKTKEIIDGDYKMYFYDSFDRLKEVVEGDSSIEEAYSKGKITNYVYDPYSNIIEKSIWQDNGRLKETYTYNQNNQLTSKKVEDKAELFSYDKQGNLVNKKEVLPGGTYFINYTYDGKNRLETVNNNDEISASYTYRYDGLRHSKTVDGETKYFTYNGGNITSELTSDGTYNYYRGSSMIGIKDPTGEKYYFTQNNKGDIISLKDATGNPVDTYSYDAFGNKNEDTEKLYFQGEWEKETSQVCNPFGYCGEYFDEETGFVYLRGRYYDPATERFITEDPTKDGANWYGYCGNDPVNATDPSGLTKVTDGKNTYERVYNNQKKKYTDYYVCKGTSGLSRGNPDKNSGYTPGTVKIGSIFNQKTIDKIRRNGASLVVGGIPVVGDIKDVQEAVTGKDYIAKEKLSNFDRGVTGICILLPCVSGEDYRLAKEPLKKLGKKAIKLLEGGSDVGFKTEELLTNHFEKHASEFGNITKEQYLSKAQNFANSKSGGNVLTKARANGDVVIYNKATNEFAVRASDGTIRTYFKPTGGLDYFNRQ